MNSKKFLVLALAILLIIILLCLMVQIPRATEVTAAAASELSQSGAPPELSDTISSHISGQTDFPYYYSTVYIVENRYFLRETETLYVIPYVTADVRDVGTAGTSHWLFSLNVLSFSQTGSTAIKGWNSAKIKDFVFTVQAGSNTVMTSEFTHSFVNELSVTQEELESASANSYTVILGAATEHSSETANAECWASFRWTGSIAPGAFMPSIPFEVSAAQEYLGNLKSE